MANNFAEAMQQGYGFGVQQRQEREKRSKLAELQGLSSQVIGGDLGATDRAFALDPAAAKAYQGEGDRRKEQLAELAKGWKQIPREQKQAYYERFVAPAVSSMGFGDLGQYNETEVDGIADQILAAYGQGGAAGNVQSTYIDSQGNRVAIMRDGTTQVLGQNAPNNQIIDTGNGFFGVNKGSLQAAPVNIGGQPSAPQQQLPGAFIDPSLPPAVQAQIRQSLSQGQEPPSEMFFSGTPSGASQQLRSAPKPPATPAGYRTLPDGSMEPIPGGPAQIAIDARAEAAAARKAAEEAKNNLKTQETNKRLADSRDSANELVAAINDLENHEGFSDLGTAWGDAKIGAPMIRSAAKDADAKLKNIAGQVALATLSRLKTLSSAGATGFGALSAPELTLVQNSIASLQSENISNAEIKRSLRIIREKMQKVADWEMPADEASPTPATGQVRRKYNPATGRLE